MYIFHLQVGIVIMGSTVRSDFYLNTYSSRSRLYSAIRSLRYVGGSSIDLVEGFQECRTQFSESRGLRVRAEQVIIVISASRISTRDYSSITSISSDLHRRGKYNYI